VHALDAGRVDEDFVVRAGQGQLLDAGARELERDGGRGRPLSSIWKKLVRTAASMRFTKWRRMRSSSRLVTDASSVLDLGRTRPLALRGPVVLGAGVEAGVEQGDDPAAMSACRASVAAM
jgi:hypothetical protein